MKKIAVMFSCFVLSFCLLGMKAAASGNVDPVIVVSLGDSYSSGEGIEPFFGQEKEWEEKKSDKDWLAHRSMLSWPSQLVIPGIEGKMADYRSTDLTGDSPCKWYFVASSGAVAQDITSQQQRKMTRTYAGWLCWKVAHVSMPRQITVFDSIEGDVDYVTMTIGGNDVDFAKIITTCVTKSTYLGSKTLEKKLEELWDNFDTTESKIKKVYTDVQSAAGPQAEIIVAGYPKLLEKTGKGFFISKDEAEKVNSNVTMFNQRLNELVAQCANEGLNIHFVDVEAEFDKDGGHQAYCNDPWINEIMLTAQDQDIDCLCIGSAYSIHPNKEGAEAYARCVNAKIQEIENSKRKGTLSGKVCEAVDRITPIQDATISVYRDGQLFLTKQTNESGNYTLTLPEGNYRVEIEAENHISFSAYATVTYSQNTYMETFLMVFGSEGEIGTSSGTIHNALTGGTVEGVSLTVRKGWNNLSTGDVVSTIVTDENGCYSVTLPIGNYTLYAEKPGFVAVSFNIVVQTVATNNQNASITPIISGDKFRVVLTWGLDPRDLDSHMEGTLSNGGKFHVFYGSKSAFDGEVEVCNLDVDDVTSYGPETITLNATNSTPYYYYIHRFAGSGSIATSSAKIMLYQGENLVATFNVPTDLGSDDYWNVFAISNGELVIKNTMTSSPDTFYASTDGANE
ncbi:MAG: carboxypeptidase regulatory-like domain-containing protein [Acetatifactor sp.]